MRSRNPTHFVGCCVAVIAIAACQPPLWAAAAPTVDEVIQQFESALHSRSVCSVSSQEIREFVGPKGTTRERSEWLVQTDGLNLRSKQTIWAVDNANQTQNGIEPRQLVVLWSGGTWYMFNPIADPPLRDPALWVRHDNQIQARYMQSRFGAALDGVFPGDLRPLPLILKTARTVSLSDQREVIDNSSCYRVNAAGTEGSYSLWIDPGHGYNLAKAISNKQHGDSYVGMPMNTNRTPASYTFEIREVKFEKHNDVWFAADAEFATDQVQSDGQKYHQSVQYHCTSMQLDGEFDRAKAFAPDFPDGTEVVDFAAYLGVPWTWSQGSVVPSRARLNELVRHEIDRAMLSLPAGVTVGGDIQTQQNALAGWEIPSLWVAGLAGLAVVITLLVIRSKKRPSPGRKLFA